MFTFLTFMNYELEIIETKIKKINIKNKNLENELSFLKTEWEYLNSPHNISILSKKYFNHTSAELIDMQDFIKILNYERANIQW